MHGGQGGGRAGQISQKMSDIIYGRPSPFWHSTLISETGSNYFETEFLETP